MVNAIREVLDLLWQTRVLYYYIFGKNLNLVYNVEYVLNNFVEWSEWMGDINHKEIIEICKEDEVRLKEIKEEIEKFIK